MKHFQLKRPTWLWLGVLSTFLLSFPGLIQAQTLEPNYGIPPSVDVANGVYTFNVKISGGAAACNAATLDITLPPGYIYISGSATLDASVTGNTGIIEDQTPINQVSNTGKVSVKNIPTYPGVTEISYKAYAGCGVIGTNNPTITHSLSGCSAQPQSVAYGVITRNAQINITNITNKTYNGALNSTYSRKITLRNDGYGAIDTFYLDSRNQSGLDITGFTSDPGATVTVLSTTTAGVTTKQYKIVKATSLKNGESFSITEEVRIANCAGPYNTDYTTWFGLGGTACSSLNNTSTAGATLNNPATTMTVTRRGAFPVVCRGDQVSDTLVLKNTGGTDIINPQVALGSATNSAANLFSYHTGSNLSQSGSTNYLIDGSTIRYSIVRNGVPGAWSTLASDSTLSLPANASGVANSCFGGNDKALVWSHLATTLLPGDSVIFVVKGKQCTYTDCASDATAATQITARFENICGVANTASGGALNLSGALTLSAADFPIDVVPGEKIKLGYTISSGSFSDALYKNGTAEIQITLPAEFIWTGNTADLNIYKGSGNPLNGANISYNSGVLTIRFTPNTTANYYNGTNIEISNITVNPAITASTNAVIHNEAQAKRLTSCATSGKLSCSDASISVVAGDGGDCTNGGISTGRIIAQRKNYGEPDASNNGTVNGTLDMNKVKTQYVMTGDTLVVTYWGRVTTTSVPMTGGGLEGTFSARPAKLAPINSSISLYNNAAQKIGNDVIKSITKNNNSFSLAFDATDFGSSRPALQNGDSLVVHNYFRIIPENSITGNDNTSFMDRIIISGNGLHLTNSSGTKYRCGLPLRQWFNIVSLRSFLSQSGNRNIAGCGDLDYSINFNIEVGGTSAPFVFERRNVARVQNATYTYPNTLVYGGTTNGVSSSSVSGNPLVYNGAFTNFPNTIDESKTGLLIKPSINVTDCNTVKPSDSITGHVQYTMYPDWNTVRQAYIGHMVNSINKPALAMTSALANTSSVNDTATWVVQINVTNTNAANTYIAQTAGIGTGQIFKIEKLSNINAATGTALTKTGDFYQNGTINNNATQYFKIYATYNSCTRDTMSLMYGWDCGGYPSTIQDAKCHNVFGLTVTPLTPGAQLIIASPPSGQKYSLCDTIEYEVEVTNSGQGVLAKPTIKASLPVTGGIVYVPESFQVKPVSGGSYIAIQDNYVSLAGDGTIAFTFPEDKLAYLYSADKFRLKFKITFSSCDFTSGSRLSFMPAGTTVCGTPVTGTGQSSQQIILNEAPQSTPQFTFNSSVDSVVACSDKGTQTTYRFKMTNNTLPTSVHDGFIVAIPPTWELDVNSIIFANGNPTSAAFRSKLSGNRYEFTTGTGLGQGNNKSLEFTATLSNAAVMACGSLDSLSEIGFTEFNAICAVKGLDCDIKQLHATPHFVKIKVQRPEYSISSFTADRGTLPNHLVGNITLRSQNNIHNGQKGTLKIYKDVNADGIRDNGDTMLGSQDFTLSNQAEQTLSYDLSGYLGQVCPLIAVFEGCYCDTPTAKLSNCNITLEPLADLNLSKVADIVAPYVGDTVTFEIKVNNLGPNHATGVTIADTLPSGFSYISHSGGNYNPSTYTWTIGNLDSGKTTSLFIKAAVNAAGHYTNIAQVSSANEKDPNSTPNNNEPGEDDQDSATVVPVKLIDLGLEKTVDAISPYTGDTVHYTITVVNKGPSQATGVTVTDKLPSGLSFISATPAQAYALATGIWTIGAIDSGAHKTLTIKARVNATGNYLNIAEVATANEEDKNSTPGNNNPAEDDQDSVRILPVPLVDLSLTKTVDERRPFVSDTVSYTLTVVNKGPSKATGVAVSDNLPSGLAYISSLPANDYQPATGTWTIGDIDSGSSKTLTIKARVNASGNYLNIAEVSATNEKDKNSTPGNNNPLEDDQDSVSVQPKPLIDLSLAKVVDKTTPYVGDTVSYTITVVNKGPSRATAVTVSDKLPSGLGYVSATPQNAYSPATGTWTIGNLDSNASAILTIRARVNAYGDYINIAEVATANEEDRNSTPGNNDPREDDQDSAHIQPIPLVDLSLTKTVNETEPYAGTEVAFTLNLHNDGPSAATGVSVLDLLPSGYEYISHTGGNYDAQSGIWNVGKLDSGATTALDITVMIAEKGEYTNIAQVHTTNEKDKDSTPGNNDPGEDDQDEAITYPKPPLADLSISKTDYSETYVPGTAVTYTVVVKNDGPSRIKNARITDVEPAGTTITTWTATFSGGAKGNASGSRAIDELVDMPKGSSIIYAVVVGVPSGYTGDLVNIAEVKLPEGATDPTPGNNQATDTDTQHSIADVSIVKSGPATASVNDTISYTIVVANNGPSDADGTIVYDAAVQNLKLIGIDCVEATGLAQCPVPYSTVEALQNGFLAIRLLPSFTSVTFKITGVVTGAADKKIVNIATATVPSHITDENPGNNADTATTFIGEPLPVDFQSFTASAEENKAKLEWITVSETHNKGFNIERSINGQSWTTIHFAPSRAENGNSSSALKYLAYDETPLSGLNYYRLKQEDLDGQYTYSEVRTVNFAADKTLRIYPNPTSDKVFIDIAQWEDIKEVRIQDIKGSTIYKAMGEDAREGIQMTSWSNGSYMLLIEQKDGSLSSFKVVKY